MQRTKRIEKIRKRQVRFGDNCRDVINARARREGDIGRRGTPIDDEQQDVIEKSPVMVARRPKQSPIRTENGPKQSPLPKPGRRNR
jgi:hypothetical protein